MHLSARVLINTVLTSQNHLHAEQLIKQLISTGIKQVRFGLFIPIETGAKFPHLMLNSEKIEECKQNLIKLKMQYQSIAITFALIDEKSCDGCGCSSTDGCAATSTLIINNDLTLPACGTLTEEDRTSTLVATPELIEDEWLNNRLFSKWRGIDSEAVTPCIRSLKEVHKHGCHLEWSLKERIQIKNV